MPAIPAYRPGALRREAGWYAGNLHTHTVHSDGGGTLEELARKNREAGFDFIVSTEHNTARAHWEFAAVAAKVPDLLLLPGVEFTSPYGHANIYGSRPGHWFDFRFDAGEGRLPQTIKEVHDQRAVFVANHPFAMCTTCTWRYPEREWKGMDGVEVWNGKWDLTDEQAVTWWDGLLRRGLRLNAYGGSDFHRGTDALVPAARVWASRLEQGAVMDGLRQGRTVLVADPKGASLELTAGRAKPGETASGAVDVQVRMRNAEGLRLILLTDVGVMEEIESVGSGEQVRAFKTDLKGRRFLRAELRRGGRKGEMIALTNAIFVH
jgi:predicted metal-dependent phosphoesterase TrpH